MANGITSVEMVSAMAQDLTAEADSGGHTDNRPALALLPTMLSLRDEFNQRFRYDEPLCVGLAGGIATPAAQQREVETRFLLASFEETWQQTRAFFLTRNIREVERAKRDPKHKMSLVFRSYLGQSSRWAITGEPNRKMDFQIWCGPSMGAFNQWVRGSLLKHPENRRVVDLALSLLVGASVSTRAG
ncbi:MAG: hypothetical protein RBR67_20690 [Desulfobacterium sp.]|nr:hypothetical protein [Desulfobacterium sp.]